MMARGVRLATFGLIVGSLVSLGLVIRFPVFFSSFLELWIAPVALGLAGLVLGALVGLVRKDAVSVGRRVWVVAGCAMALVVVAYAARWPHRAWTASPGVVLFGIDGATWDIIEPMMQAGELPAFARLVEEGTSGSLRSFEPTLSPIIWTSIASGRRPEDHGINSFYATQASLRAKRIWEVLDEQDRKVGVFRWWVSWPPREVNGFLIPGILARDSRTHPESLSFVNQLRIDHKGGKAMSPREFAGFLYRFLNRGLRLRTGLQVLVEQGRAYLSEDHILKHEAGRRTELRINADIYAGLLREHELDYTSFYDNGVDVLCHYYWKYFEPEAFPDVTAEEVRRYREIIPDSYRQVDEVLGELLEHLDPSTTLVIVSDHGLEASSELTAGELRPRVKDILASLGLDEGFYGIALAGRTYVESVKTTGEEAALAIAGAVDALLAVRVVETGEQMFEAAVQDDGRIRLFIRKGTDESHHALLQDGREVAIADWVSKREGRSGTHSIDGIFLARGPGIRRGHRIEGATVLDVAPTLLHLAGSPVARDLEGRVLVEAFTERYRARPIRTVESYGQFEASEDELVIDEETRRKLEALGYVG